MDIPNTRRFFVPPEVLSAAELQLDDPQLAHQLGRVLRLGPGDVVLMLDGEGTACEVELRSLGRNQIVGSVRARRPAGGEPPFEATIYLGLMRPERFEWALQKCVELGARQLVPVQFARSLSADRADAKKLERWRRIVREAAEQSCRGRLPTVSEPLLFRLACEAAAHAELALLLWEGAAPPLRTLLRERGQNNLGSISVLSGPEGGITGEELTAARERGIIAASLGPRILRAETAPVAALAALVYELEAQLPDA